MEYIITINVNITYIDANQKSEHDGFTTGPVRVDQNDPRSVGALIDHVVLKYMPPGLELIRYHATLYYDGPPGFGKQEKSHRDIPIQQFIRSKKPSSSHLDRKQFTFVVSVAARPAAAINVKFCFCM